jgi:sugar O-acyltransferase (sialic acid O-acetyltransferase NeuD family)
MVRKLLLLGGGGHCKSIIDSLSGCNTYAGIGIVEKSGIDHAPILGIPVVGTDEDLEKLKREGYTDAFVSLGSIGNTSNRRKLFGMIATLGFCIPNIIDDSAIVSSNSILGRGSFIGKHAVVNAGSVLGDGVIINSSATVEHDCVIGAFAHVSPGVVLCGNVTIGVDAHIGAGSIVRQQVQIGNRAIIGMCSIVLHDVPDNTLAYGSPCQVVRSL